MCFQMSQVNLGDSHSVCREVARVFNYSKGSAGNKKSNGENLNASLLFLFDTNHFPHLGDIV